ncbi:scarecrow-like protein 9 [Chenopodium quinoa]|uniref:Scarecrow-like protein 9 n=1 Tax=Chenopodium quinoa TaxID=63459 RepID=A0A803N6L3_CHEQI|nr:scarecrow-like protein 9 [Chenopodium quinoa]
MDPRVHDYVGLANGIRFQSVNDHGFPVYSNYNYDYVNELPNLGNGLVVHNNYISDVGDVNFSISDTCTRDLSLNSSVTEGNLNEEYDFSDSVLTYINQILMEEDVEGKGCMLQESLQHQAVQDAEKSLYEVNGKSSLLKRDSHPNPSYFCSNLNNPDSCSYDDSYRCYNDGSIDSNSFVIDPSWGYGKGEYCGSDVENGFPVYQLPVSSNSSTSASYDNDGGLVDSQINSFGVSGLCTESQSIYQFNKGVEEANKFLPIQSDFLFSTNMDGLIKNNEEKCNVSLVNPSVNNGDDDIREECRGRKHAFGDTEERLSKLAAIYDDSKVRSDMFDKVLLHHGGDKNELVVSLRTNLQTAATKKTEQNDESKSGPKGRHKRQGGRKEVVDLRTLLTTCAQSVAADDRRTAYDFLKQIRQHSSPLGDGNQRLAHYVADGLEARLAGTGSQIYKGLTSKRTTAADVLKAYLLYLAACPFRKLSNFFSNKSIAKRTRKASKIHIIDFGILYGFQWPTFIQRQSMREGGPPRIKITGIDFPQPGFRPAERVEETGRRLENYAQEFKVPFEYRAIAKRWDTIQLEDFDIDEGEVLIVNCIYRLKNLPDETVSVESSRNKALKLIRKLNPDVFINGVVNGSYSAPYFVTRFREALFHFSAQFDMLETIVPREYSERMLIERDLLAREALNVVACEGWERVERPETYKQWKIRIIRAGFTQLPLDSEIKERALLQVHSAYHKDFMIDEDSRWLLLGWKGRVLFALSTWQPT